MRPHLTHLRPPAAHPRRRDARVTRDAARSSTQPEPAASALRDRGLGLLAVFTGAGLVIVLLVGVVGLVDRAWILVPVMIIHLALTAVVLLVMIRLLDDRRDQ